MTLMSGTAIFIAIWLLGAAFCFWTVRATEAVNVFTYGGTTLASYPLDIFDRWARQFALFILPLAWVSYVPALYLLDRADRSGLPTWLPAPDAVGRSDRAGGGRPSLERRRAPLPEHRELDSPPARHSRERGNPRPPAGTGGP